ncbi:MAG: CHC2 zinc finger domain-containing protein [Pyrinomonadaceae bacterium MAG19_C2-C3]|nr:CHC2 zinc finger domain-containing protein [Pyrinomonadaceae bacterium MAG19_C2-C3]
MTDDAHHRRERLRELCEAVKSRLDYQRFYQSFCPHARVSGNRLQALCPIPSHAHSGKGHPALSVDLTRGLFHCFSRDEGGDAIRFYELMRGVSFTRAVGELAKEVGLDADTRQLPLSLRAAPDIIESETPDVSEKLSLERRQVICAEFLRVCRREDGSEGMNYLQKRGINRATCERLGVTYFPRESYRRVMRSMRDGFAVDELQRSGLFNSREHLTFYLHRLLFPFYVEGVEQYFQARTTSPRVQPRWHNMPGNIPSLYNIDTLDKLQSDSIVYLVEGFTDTLTLISHNFNAVGLVGAGGMREEWLPPLARFQIVLILDPDEAGNRATARYAEMFEARGMNLATLDLASDVNDFFRARSSVALELELLTDAALERKSI